MSVGLERCFRIFGGRGDEVRRIASGGEEREGGGGVGSAIRDGPGALVAVFFRLRGAEGEPGPPW